MMNPSELSWDLGGERSSRERERESEIFVQGEVDE